MSRALVHVLPASLLVYTVVALVKGRWVSGLGAPIVAWLLWSHHARARFSAYVLFTVIAARAVFGGPWWLLVYAATAIVLLQTSAARGAWPRLRFAWRAGDKMSRP